MKRLFAIPILLFLAFLGSLYFVLPKYAQFALLKEEIESKEAALLQRKDYSLELKKMADDLEKHKEALAKIEAALPPEPSLPELLDYFQLRASENGLLLQAIGQVAQPAVVRGTEEMAETKEKLKTRTKETFVQITLIGSVFSFENFLKAIEKSSRLIEVETISLQMTKEELPAFNVLIKVYSY